MSRPQYESSVAKYEEVWSGVLEAARRHAAAEGQLSRAVRLIEAERRSTSADPAAGIAFGQPVTLPAAVLMGGRLALKSHTLIEHSLPGADLIVELGSGWGLNLFDIYLSGGPRAHYVAMEPTLAGRTASEVLAALEPDLEFHALPFDFRKPDYSGLKARRALVFSSHAIEQVPELSREAITGLFDVAPDLTCVHFEPVGWQTGAISDPHAARAYAERADYNRNLWPLLQTLEAEGRIVIDRMVPDIFSHKAGNASTLIVWRRT